MRREAGLMLGALVLAACGGTSANGCPRPTVLWCMNGTSRVCVTDARGCDVCSCERGAPPGHLHPYSPPR
ncbi:MAG: hypothetical protein IT378_20790 [Sandaracinaceae bacterium]|nr:hypothetical protein [Sandaracinaceae bacterium]